MLLYNCLPVLSNLHRNLPFLTCTDSSYYSLNDIHTTGFFVSALCSIKKSGNPVDILNQRGMEGQGMASTYTVLVVITKNHMQEKKQTNTTKWAQKMPSTTGAFWSREGGQPPGDPPVNMTLLCSQSALSKTYNWWKNKARSSSFKIKSDTLSYFRIWLNFFDITSILFTFTCSF